MPSGKTATRRSYSAEFQAQVRCECDAPGASVAKVAMAHGINANVVHRWRQLDRQGRAANGVNVTTPTAAALASANAFVPVVLKPAPMSTPVAKPAVAVGADIRIQLRRGATAVAITWPVSAASQCAAWLREWLA